MVVFGRCALSIMLMESSSDFGCARSAFAGEVNFAEAVEGIGGRVFIGDGIPDTGMLDCASDESVILELVVVMLSGGLVTGLILVDFVWAVAAGRFKVFVGVAAKDRLS